MVHEVKKFRVRIFRTISTYLTKNTERVYEEYKREEAFSKNENPIDRSLLNEEYANSYRDHYECMDVNLFERGLSEHRLSILTAGAFERASSESREAFVMVLLLSVNLQKLTAQSRATDVIQVLAKMLRQPTSSIINHLLHNLDVEELGHKVRIMNDLQRTYLMYAVNLLMHTDAADDPISILLLLSMGGITDNDYFSVIQGFKAV
ncbi:hypothetical protein [Spirosoma panaciterrae]|uniref:hypothetical protein n=1 Tax=Spirosoma panaciterrae TaxID=496058 RepID=UPI000366DF7A|nr:hypothetical protein [Spirosoma panaciterrae]